MDWHQNCFYTYNHSNELIENNLTRAFIVTLQLLSEVTRIHFLQTLHQSFNDFNLKNLHFALQSWVKKSPRAFTQKKIVTISTKKTFPEEKSYHRIDSDIIASCLRDKAVPAGTSAPEAELMDRLVSGSIPDGWIHSETDDFCFLIECKIGGSDIDYAQLIRHAYENFGICDLDQVNSALVRVTWQEILEAIDHIYLKHDQINTVERKILSHLAQYLGFFGYRLFKGFKLRDVKKIETVKLLNVHTKKRSFRINELRKFAGPKLLEESATSRMFSFSDMKKSEDINLL